MIDVQQLECFCAVVRSGSFSKAAAVLAIGQPSLSRQVRRLEEQLGSKLLYRNGRGVALTPSGSQFHETVSNLIVQLKVAYNQAADGGVAPAGEVTLGLPTSMSSLVGAPVLRTLQMQCPGIKLRLMDGFSGHVHEWLVSGRIDLAILHEARHAPAIAVEHLLSEDLFLVGRDAPAKALAEGSDPRIALPDLTALPVRGRGTDPGRRRKLYRGRAPAGADLRVENEIDSLSAIKELIDGGGAYSVLPIGCVHREVLAGTLKVWRIIGPNVVNTMVLAAAQNRPFTSAMQKVRSALRERIGIVAETQTGWHAGTVDAASL